MILNRIINPSEARAISYQSLFAAGDDVALGTESGVRIDQDTVFSVNAVFSAVSLIADTISTLPLHAYKRNDDTRVDLSPQPQWLRKPDADLPAEAFWNSVVVSLLLEGNAFVRAYYNARGEVVTLTVLNPTSVEVTRDSVGRLIFNVEGEGKPLTTDEIVYIPDVLPPGKVRGISRVKALKESFGLALALERFASTFFGQGTNLNGVIEFPGNLTEEQAKQLTSAFDNRHKGWRRGHKTGVLSGGATFKPTQIDPQQSQALEARHMAVEDIARAFNVPPHLLALPGTNSYASVEQTNLAWVTHGLRPILTKIEGAISPLLSRYPNGDGAYIKFNLDGLLRADIQSRMSAYSTGLQSGFLTINDVRKLEELAPMDDPSADVVRVPLANVNLDEAGVKAQRERVAMARDLIWGGFNPEGVLAALGLPSIEHTGVPSAQLQPAYMLDPEDPESVYKDEVS